MIMKQFYEIYNGKEKLSTLSREISWSNNVLISVCLVIANSYGIDVEKWIPVKEKLHNAKWNNDVVFDPK